MDRDQQTDRVKAVSNASECKTQLDTKLVDECTSEETKDGECTVKRSVLIDQSIWLAMTSNQQDYTNHVVCQSGIGFATTSEAAKSIKHSRAQEADERDHAQLELW